MSYSVNTSQEPLNFLKTVVDQGSGQTNKNGTDSDKENEHRDAVTTTSIATTVTKQFSLSLSASETTSSSQKVMAQEDADMWDEFYSEEDFEELKKQENVPNDEFDILRPKRSLDKVEEEEEEDYINDSTATDTKENNMDDHSSKPDEEIDDSERNSSKRKKKKRLFKRRAPPPLSPKSRMLLPIGGSHPNLSDNNHTNRTEQNANLLETMSDTSGGERKLNRRKQVSRPRCAGPRPNGDRLEQKYQELEHLMLKPLTNPAVYVQQTRQQMLRLQGLSTQYHSHNSSSHNPPTGLPPTGQHTAPRDMDRVNGVIQVIEEDTNQAYSTIRTVQAVNVANRNNNRPKSAHPKRRPLSGQRQRVNRPQSADQARPSTANRSSETSSVLNDVNQNHNRISRDRRPYGREGVRKTRSDSSTSGGSPKRSDRSESRSKDRDYASSFEDGTGSRSASRSPGRAVQTTDNHLRNSSNPALRQWLKVKDKEYRKQKREERKKKSKERAEKQEEEMKKEEFFKKAEEKVKEWMTQKRKEAWKQQKEERKRMKEEAKDMAEQQIRHTESLRGKMFTPIKRPPGKYEGENKNTKQNQQQDANDTTTTPQPPKSKFVYKRPVSGRVRLMKLQQERKEDSKKQEEKKKEMDKLLAEEKERKMRMSYDQWLLKKREDDYAKRKDVARQRAMAKSDPELDRIVPELARKRIENIKRGRKRIDTGDNSINKSVNESFGGGDFREDGEKVSPSYRLEVSGGKKTLKQRPSSAKNASSSSGGMFNPKISKSPRRPQSANPRVQALMNENQESTNDDQSFKLPFPPELGVPKYVAARQEKLFSEEVIASANASFNGDDDAGALNVDGVVDNVKVTNNEGQATGSDHVDAEVEFVSDLKSVAVSLMTEKIDKGIKGDSEEDEESFFVTHGNMNENADDDDNDEKAEVPNENVEDEKNENQDAIVSESADVDLDPKEDEDKEEENSVMGDTIEKEKGDELGGNENERDDYVPPLDIGDDDADIKYEEEDKEENEEKMDIANSVSDKDKEEKLDSGLLAKVEEVSDSTEVKSSIKHVSFSEEAMIHEDPLAGRSNDVDFFYDYEDERSETDQIEGEEETGGHPLSVEEFNYEHLGEIEDEDEAEDERGGYFDDETPRDDEF